MRKIIVVLLMLCAKIAQAQIYIDSYRFAQAPPANLLLDDYPGAAAAYSVRALSSTYTGPLMQVRRTDNGNTYDIYALANGALDETYINTVCSGTSCTVQTWYDQSGNGRNAVQATPVNQPIIYESNSIILQNNKPALKLNVTLFLTTPVFPSTANASYFFVSKANPVPNYGYLFATSLGTPAQNYAVEPTPSSRRYLYTGQALVYDNSNSYQQELGSLFFPNTTPFVQLYINSLNQTMSPSISTQNTNTNRNIFIGTYANSVTGWNGNLQEFIIYFNTSQLTNRTGIESNINSYYSIY